MGANISHLLCASFHVGCYHVFNDPPYGVYLHPLTYPHIEDDSSMSRNVSKSHRLSHTIYVMPF